MASVSAADLNETIVVQTDNNEVIEIEEASVLEDSNQNCLESDNSENILSEPKTVTVTDKSFTGINNAIKNANEGDTIILDGTYYRGSSLKNSLKSSIVVDKKLNIVGINDATLNNLCSNGDYLLFFKYRIFEFKSDGIIIEGITFKNGDYYGNGGAIYSNNDFSIDNCKFINNHATGCAGAIFVGKSSRISNCYFEGNSAQWGGAILNYKYSEGLISNCTFKKNTASQDSGAVSGSTVSQCKFIENTAVKYGGATSWTVSLDCTYENNKADGDGAAIYNGEASNSIFINNTAKGKGGAIALTQYHEVNSCSFINNSAQYGGAICKPEGDKIESKITNSNFTGNHATQSGGAVCIQDVKSSVLENCSFKDNYASRSGAVDYYRSSNINISQCEFINSTSTDSAGSIGLWTISSISLSDCNFTDSTSNKGGAIYWSEGDDLEIDGCQFKNCVSTDGSSYIGLKSSNSKIVDCLFDLIPEGVKVTYDSILTVNNISIVQGEEGIITAKLSNIFGPMKDKYIKFSVDGNDYIKTTDNKGFAYFKATDCLNLGSYVVNVSFDAQGFNNAASVDSIVRINNYIGNLTVTQRGKYYDDTYLDFKLTDKYTKNPISKAQIYLEFSNGKTATLKTDDNGACSYKVPLTPGIYSFKAYDIASNVDVNTVEVNDFEIKKLTGKIELSREGESRRLQIKVYNPENGDVYRNVKVILSFSDGVNRMPDLTNEKGITTYYMGFVYGTYSVSARTEGEYQEFDSGYLGNIVINANSGPMDDIHSVEVAFNKKSLIFDYSKSGSVTVAVVGGSIKQENIEVIGYPGAAKISNNIITVSGLNVGYYSLRILPTGDAEHYSEPVYYDIQVNKLNIALKASKISVPLKKSSLWKITLKDSKTGNPIRNMEITLKVFTGKKYKTVTRTTNSKGEATYQTKSLSKGTHKVVVSSTHEGYKLNIFTSSIKVVKQTALKFKVKRVSGVKDGDSISITVINKKTKKPLNGVKIKLLIKNGKKYKTVILKSFKKGKYKGVCGYATNKLSVGKHTVKIVPVSIKYKGSAKSVMKITKMHKKKPAWETKDSGK